MQKIIRILLCSAALLFMLGGCSGADNNRERKQAEESSAASDTFISVQEYTGEGYFLVNGKVTGEIAERNREQITKAAQKFFQDKYQIEVKVYNLAGGRDSVTVFLESAGEPHFYTYAVVPIDVKKKKVLADQIWADENEVQNAIKGGLYQMIFSEEFKKLDHYLESLKAEGQVTGKTIEALQNTGGNGYMTPYYFIVVSKNEEAINPVYDLYQKNHNESFESLRNAYDASKFSADNLTISIQLFMKDKKAEPDEELFNRVTKELQEMNNIPKGSYGFYLNDNFIHRETAKGVKENSLRRGFPDYIIKD